MGDDIAFYDLRGKSVYSDAEVAALRKRLAAAEEACRLARVELSYCDHQITGRPYPPADSSVGKAILACEAVLGKQVTRSLVESA